MKIAEFVNSVELDEVAQNAVIKPSNQKIEKGFSASEKARIISWVNKFY